MLLIDVAIDIEVEVAIVELIVVLVAIIVIEVISMIDCHYQLPSATPISGTQTKINPSL